MKNIKKIAESCITAVLMQVDKRLPRDMKDDFVKIVYIVLGKQLPSEHQYKLARVIEVKIKDNINSEAERTNNDGTVNISWDELIYTVITEDNQKIQVYNSEVDHFVKMIP